MVQAEDENLVSPYETGNSNPGDLRPKNIEPVDPHIPAPYIFVLPLIVGILLSRWISWRVIPDGAIGFAVGWSLIVGAILLILWARTTMSTLRESIFSREATNTLVTTGPYRFSRNPIYVAYALIYVGIAFNVNTIWPIVFLPAVLGFVQYAVIAYEERYLERLFSDEYLSYKARVRRWLPFPTRISSVA